MTENDPVWTGSGLGFTGYGHYFPRTLINQDGDVTVGGRTYAQDVVAALGVRSLHRADDDETVEYMATAAANTALMSANLPVSDVDLVVLANWTDRQWIPEIGPEVARRLGATRALAFDVCGACTGFVHGVQVAAAMLSAHREWQHAVVVASDRFTRRARPGTRGQLVFGDAAGAVVLSKGQPELSGLLDGVLDCDAEQADTVAARDGWLRPQPELIDLAVRSSIGVAENLLRRNRIKVSDVDHLVPHPGNNEIHAGVRDGLDLPKEKFRTNFATRGNTGCASIPIALSEFLGAGQLRRGDLVLSTAVGSGWYYGGLLFTL